MNKKIATIALVSILAISTVFAGGLFKKTATSGPDISVGLTTGFDQDILFPEKTDSSISYNQVPVKATGLFKITDNFAVKANLGMAVNMTNDSNITETKVGFATDVLAYYVLPLAKSFDLYLGGGFGYDYVNLFSKSNKLGSVSSSIHTMDIALDVMAAYEVVDHVQLMGGVNLGFDVLKSLTGSGSVSGIGSDNGSASMLENAFGMQWGINVGAAYKF